MRLFIAIEIPKSVRRELANIREKVRSKSSDGRFVPDDNMHITLHFIGESNDPVSAVQAMQKGVSGIRPFYLIPGEYGCFSKGAQRTSFVSVQGDLDELNALYESLQSALGDRGFRREQKKYKPHITLGRGVKHDEAALDELSQLTCTTAFTVNDIVLFESKRVEGRMIYTPLHKEKF